MSTERVLIDHQTPARIRAGWQCPECYSAHIDNRRDEAGRLEGFLCTECGCEFGSRT